MASAKKEILDTQKVIEELDAKLEEIQAHITATKEQLEPKVQEYTDKAKQCEEKMAQVDPRIAEVEQKRETFIKQIEGPVEKIYSSTARKISPALANATSKTCSECGTRIPPQIFNQIIVAEEVQYCTGCRRILYIDAQLEA